MAPAFRFVEGVRRSARLRWLMLLVLLSILTPLWASESYKLDVPFQSSVGGIAEVFYDTGHGFTKDQISRLTVRPSRTMVTLKFILPEGVTIYALRLDPLAGTGSLEIGPASIEAHDGRVASRFDLAAYQVRQQLNIISKGPKTLKLEVPPGATDPILMINLKHPIDLKPTSEVGTNAKPQKAKVLEYDWPVWLDGGLIVLALCVLGVALFYPTRPQLGRSVSTFVSSPRFKWLDTLASKLSDSEIIIFDRVSLMVLFGAFAIFVLFCVLQLHGSSTSIWDYQIARESPHSGLLWGHPKGIRSDEFNVFTPNIFSQVYSTPPFSTVNRTVGGEKSVLFWSFPVNHFIEIPRFYLWPFHFLKIGLAFSIYWNLKGLILFTGSYLLLLILTGSRSLLAAAGALWIYFSSFTQWWFSHCLPETMGFSMLTLVGALYLLLSRKRSLVYLGAMMFTIALLNFALIPYPPFTIPLAWVMLSVGLGIFIGKRNLLLGPDPLKIRWLLLLLGIVLCGATLDAFLLDTEKTIHLIRDTVYPGHRFNTGGTETLLTLFTSFIDPVFTEKHIPNIVTNVCTGTHYYLIGLLLLPVMFVVPRERRRFAAVDVTMALCGLTLIVFVLVGFPHWLAGVTLASMTETKRAKVGVGLAMIFLVMRHFSRVRVRQRIEAAELQTWLLLLLLLTVAFVFFHMISGYELPEIAIVMLLTVNAVLLLFGIAGQGNCFFAVLLPFLLSHDFLINPIATGFTAITEKNLYREVRKIRRVDPQSAWVWYGNFHLADFLKFCGVNLINGNKFYPVFEYNEALDPERSYINIWNSYAHIECIDRPEYPWIYYEQMRGPVYRINAPAGTPAWRKIGVRYCVLTYPPPREYQSAVIKEIHDGSQSFWILRQDLLPAVR